MTTFTTLDDPLATSGTVAWDINDSGQIVGTYNVGSLSNRGFLLSGGNYTTLNGPVGANTVTARGINNQGQIVGDWSTNTPNFVTSGYILSSGTYTSFNDPANQDRKSTRLNSSHLGI